MVLLSMGIKSNAFDYLMVQAPKEVAMELVKAGFKIASFAYDPGISTITEIGVDKAKEDIIDWLVRSELLIGGGKLSISSYKTYDNKDEDFEFPYILVYNPETKEIEIVIYSPNDIKPPKSQGGLTAFNVHGGNFWDEEKWLQKGKTHLSPFTVKVSGKIEEGQYGGYLWKEGPNIDIDLYSPVPEFEFEPLSALDRQILSLNKTLLAAKNAFEMLGNTATSAGNKIGEMGRSTWDRLKSGVSNLANMGGAAVSSFFFSPDNDNATIVSLRDEASSFQEILETDEVGESDEVKELKKAVSELESELEVALQETNEPPEEDPQPTVATIMTERVEINGASIDDLTRIIHIGPARAEEIVRLRPFSSLDDLTRVSGIGEKTVSDIKEQGLAYVDYQEIDDSKEEEKEEKEEIEEIEEKETTETEKEAEVTDNPIEDSCLSNGVDLNNAPLDDLTLLKGVGPVIGQRIIDYRASSPFNSLDDLGSVNGIGPTTIENIKDQGCAYVKVTSPVEPSYAPDPVIEKKPEIEISKEKFSFRWEIGEDQPDEQFLTVKNKGDGPLNWTMSDNKWVSFETGSGTVPPGETISVILTVNPTELTTGEYSMTVPIESNSDESPHEIEISMVVLPPPRLAQSVVITEVKVNEREFVELYNPTEEDIEMTEWQLSYYSGERKWNKPYRNWEFPKDSVIQPTSHFLIGIYEYPIEDGNPDSDWELLTAGGSPYGSGQLSNDGGSLAIFDCDPKDKDFEGINECRIDAVGWGETFVRRGEVSDIPEKGESIKRRKDSQGRYVDNEDNSTDFVIGLPMPTNSKGETSDIFPPEAVTDLEVKCQDDEAILEWNAPSDPDTPQEMLVYEIRYHKEPFSEDDWEDGTLARSIPEVSIPGDDESIIIKDLNYGTDYHFGLMTSDTKNQSPLSNTVSCTTESVRYGSLWTGFQGNSQRNGRITEPTVSSNSEEQTAEISISGERDSDHIDDPVIVDNYGSIYFTGKVTIEDTVKEGLLAFDRDGELKWYYEGDANRFSDPVSLPDGGIFLAFQETMYEKSNLMKIDRDGTVDWINEAEDFYPIGQPTVSDNGRIHLLLSASDGNSGKLIAMESSDGDIDWDYEIGEKVSDNMSPVIDENGSIYLSLSDTLYSINSSGNLEWERSFPFIPSEGEPEYDRTTLSGPVIGDEAIYLFVKGESETMSGKRDYLYALNPDDPENELWKTDGLSGLRGLPAVNYNGDVFIFSFSDPVHKNTTIFGYDNQGDPLDGWPVSIPLGGMLESMVIDADNNLQGLLGDGSLRSFDVNGNERWRIDGLSPRRNRYLSIDKDGSLYLGGNRYLYTVK